MLNWATDRERIIAELMRRRSFFKILTKTKDDYTFIRSWVSHHAAIVGLSNIIIFDNCSTNSDVLSYYSEIADDALIIKFDFFHNRIHRVEQMADFYPALRQSCNYFQVLDTDERLWYMTDDALALDGESVTLALRDQRAPVVPGVWVECTPGRVDRFFLKSQRGGLKLNLSHGKPIISTRVDISGMINHNFQLKPGWFGEIVTNFFVLHLLRAVPAQRIRANYAKLVANKAVAAGTPLDDLRSIDPDKIPANNNNPRMWLKELQGLLDFDAASVAGAPLKAGEFEINGSGSPLTFYSADDQGVFSDFVRSPARYAHRINPNGSV